MAARMLVLFIAVLVGLACSSRSMLDPDPADFSPEQNVPAAGGTTAAGGTGGTAPSTGGKAASGGTSSIVVPVDVAEIEQELMARWNQVASTVPNNMCCGFNFNWGSFDKFPHPTFRLGNEAAYQGFAEVLLAFFQAGDNFDFLARNGLFRIALNATFENGNLAGSWNFEELANGYTSSTTIGNVPEATRAALAEFAARIQQTV
jgi:hypothetical protein